MNFQFKLQKKSGQAATSQRRGAVWTPITPRRCGDTPRRRVAPESSTLPRSQRRSAVTALARPGAGHTGRTLQRRRVAPESTTSQRCHAARLSPRWHGQGLSKSSTLPPAQPHGKGGSIFSNATNPECCPLPNHRGEGGMFVKKGES